MLIIGHLSKTYLWKTLGIKAGEGIHSNRVYFRVFEYLFAVCGGWSVEGT